MYTENGAIYNSGKDEKIEDLATSFPYGGVAILLLALLVKAVNLGDLARLVVSTNQGDAIRISKLVSRLSSGMKQNLAYFAFKHISSVSVSSEK